MKPFIALLYCTYVLISQDLGGIKAMGAPINPKVSVVWNRFYDFEAAHKIVDELVSAYPDLVKKEILGKSYEGREIFVAKVSNWKSIKNELERPAMYIDGNIHSNEVQGMEVSLYSIWYLAEMYDENQWIKDLLDTRIFYIVPSINPDGRDYFLKRLSNAHSPRSGVIATDNDLDGEIGEDGPDDLDGDNHISMMRRKNPYGRWKSHPDFPEYLIRAKEDEFGDWDLLGSEGIDNDGDGLVNEDGMAYFEYDPNRDWAWQWEPKYIQNGARQYPFSLPESQAVKRFVETHPNIAAAQSFHNNGGMILRGPGKKRDEYDPMDVKVFDYIGKKGEDILPDYNYWIVWKDLYEVYGGELDWFYGSLGILTFTNELWTNKNMFRAEAQKYNTQEQTYYFNKLLLFGEAFKSWTKTNHPLYGEIEIGGFKKNTGRTSPSFLLEEECHRNMAFSLFHAYHMPLLKIKNVKTEKLNGNLYSISAEIVNERVIPSRLNHDVRNQINIKDIIELESKDFTIVSSMQILSDNHGAQREEKFDVSKIKLETVPGMAAIKVRWIVNDNGAFTIRLNSVKGGVDRYESKF